MTLNPRVASKAKKPSIFGKMTGIAPDAKNASRDPVKFMRVKNTKAVIFYVSLGMLFSLATGGYWLPFMAFRALMKRASRRGNEEITEAFGKNMQGGIKPKPWKEMEDSRYKVDMRTPLLKRMNEMAERARMTLKPNPLGA